MKAFEVLGFTSVALMCMVVFTLAWVRAHRPKHKVRAYFSGGPLDGQEKKLLDAPAVYQYPLHAKTAVYKYQGSGVYLFDEYVHQLEQ